MEIDSALLLIENASRYDAIYSAVSKALKGRKPNEEFAGMMARWFVNAPGVSKPITVFITKSMDGIEISNPTRALAKSFGQDPKSVIRVTLGEFNKSRNGRSTLAKYFR